MKTGTQTAQLDLIQVAKSLELELGLAEWSSPEHAEEILQSIINDHWKNLKDAVSAAEKEKNDLQRELQAEIKKREMFQRTEKETSDAYIRLRAILKAWKTPYAPTSEQVWAHTEECAKKAMEAYQTAV